MEETKPDIETEYLGHLEGHHDWVTSLQTSTTTKDG